MLAQNKTTKIATKIGRKIQRTMHILHACNIEVKHIQTHTHTHSESN